jgi:hypothetical protein
MSEVDVAAVPHAHDASEEPHPDAAATEEPPPGVEVPENGSAPSIQLAGSALEAVAAAASRAAALAAQFTAHHYSGEDSNKRKLEDLGSFEESVAKRAEVRRIKVFNYL